MGLSRALWGWMGLTSGLQCSVWLSRAKRDLLGPSRSKRHLAGPSGPSGAKCGLARLSGS